MSAFKNEKIGHNHEGFTPIANSIWSRRNILDRYADEVQVSMRTMKRLRANFIVLGSLEDLTKIEFWLINIKNCAINSVTRHGAIMETNFQVLNAENNNEQVLVQ